jgi:hypothetical protein
MDLGIKLLFTGKLNYVTLQIIYRCAYQGILVGGADLY